MKHYQKAPYCLVSACGMVAAGANRGDVKTLTLDAAAVTCKLCMRTWRFPLPIPRRPW